MYIYGFCQYLQSTHMASQQITEEAVYLCTGNPLPKDIELISHWLLNETFVNSFNRILLGYKINCAFILLGQRQNFNLSFHLLFFNLF